jgi:plasmid stabilization system protein ParE
LPRIWSPETKEDLLDIWDYVWLDASAVIADKLPKEIDGARFMLGAWPGYGKARDDVRKDCAQYWSRATSFSTASRRRELKSCAS